MIQEFTIKNFRSIKDAETISFLASRDKTDRELHCIVPTDAEEPELLKMAVIYGANASGKSNILIALQFFVNFIINSFGDYKPKSVISIHPFVFDEQKRKEPSVFSLIFFIEKTQYQYYLELDKHGVIAEKLTYKPRGQSKLMYDRSMKNAGVEREYVCNFGSSLTGAVQMIAESTRQNASFLSTAAQFKQTELAPIHSKLVNMTSGLFVDDAGLFIQSLEEIQKNDEFKKITLDVLKSADFSNVVDVSFEENILTPMETQFIDDIVKKLPVTDNLKQKVLNAARTKVFIQHDYLTSVRIPIELESSGTRKLIALIVPLIFLTHNQILFAYDEIENSLHYDLLRFFIESFLANSSSSQILFTTHNLDLLESGFLRDDEVWFAEKDETGASHFNRISDYTGVRKGVSRKSMYEAGRFGAKPITSPLFISKNMNEHSDGNT